MIKDLYRRGELNTFCTGCIAWRRLIDKVYCLSLCRHWWQVYTWKAFSLNLIPNSSSRKDYLTPCEILMSINLYSWVDANVISYIKKDRNNFSYNIKSNNRLYFILLLYSRTLNGIKWMGAYLFVQQATWLLFGDLISNLL